LTSPIGIVNLLDVTHTRAESALAKFTYPHEILPHLFKTVLAIGKTLSLDEFFHPEEDVWIAKDAVVDTKTTLKGPLVVDREAELRPGAYIRGAVLIGKGCVVGNSTEVKNAVFFDGAKAPHFNYVGDSILGYMAHMGAGSVTSNVKLDKIEVIVKTPYGTYPTGLKKCGAILGDFVEVGCHAVLNPGTVLGRGSNVYPNASVRGFVPENTVYKDAQNRVKKIKI